MSPRPVASELALAICVFTPSTRSTISPSTEIRTNGRVTPTSRRVANARLTNADAVVAERPRFNVLESVAPRDVTFRNGSELRSRPSSWVNDNCCRFAPTATFPRLPIVSTRSANNGPKVEPACRGTRLPGSSTSEKLPAEVLTGKVASCSCMSCVYEGRCLRTRRDEQSIQRRFWRARQVNDLRRYPQCWHHDEHASDNGDPQPVLHLIDGSRSYSLEGVDPTGPNDSAAQDQNAMQLEQLAPCIKDRRVERLIGCECRDPSAAISGGGHGGQPDESGKEHGRQAPRRQQAASGQRRQDIDQDENCVGQPQPPCHGPGCRKNENDPDSVQNVKRRAARVSYKPAVAI